MQERYICLKDDVFRVTMGAIFLRLLTFLGKVFMSKGINPMSVS